MLNYRTVFDELVNISQVKLEDPVLSELFELLVSKGDFDASELFIEKAIEGMLILLTDLVMNLDAENFVFNLQMVIWTRTLRSKTTILCGSF